jgi:hypothetical protein
MYTTSAFDSQICPSLLLGRQFPNLAGVNPLPASWEHCFRILSRVLKARIVAVTPLSQICHSGSSQEAFRCSQVLARPVLGVIG